MQRRHRSGMEHLSLQSRFTTIGFALMVAVVAVWRSESSGQVLLVLPSFFAVLVASAFFVPGNTRAITCWDVGVLLLTAVTWVAVCQLGYSPYAGLACALAAAIVVTKATRRLLATALMSGLLVLPPVLAHLGAGGRWFEYAAIQVATFALILLSFLVAAYQWRLIEGETLARHAATALATAQERERIAQDLHDIQGHTLHVVGFKLAAAKVLIGEDPVRASAELTQAQQLVREAIDQSQELAFDRHEVHLREELANASRLCEAAGISCQVDVSGSLPPQSEVLAAHTVREGTTNVLRHASAKRVAIRISEEAVCMTNDGAPRMVSEVTRVGGIEGLRAAFAAAGGALSAGVSAAGLFELKGSFSEPVGGRG